MMDFESLLAALHSPRRLRPAQEFIGPNLRVTDSRIAGIADADNFLTGPDDAQIVISNPRCIRLGVFRLDHAYKNATVRIITSRRYATSLYPPAMTHS